MFSVIKITYRIQEIIYRKANAEAVQV